MLPKLLKVAYEKETYERWLTLYPFMEVGFIEFISFSEYKKKILKNASGNKIITEKQYKHNDKEMTELVKYYEKLKGKEEKNGDI